MIRFHLQMMVAMILHQFLCLLKLEKSLNRLSLDLLKEKSIQKWILLWALLMLIFKLILWVKN